MPKKMTQAKKKSLKQKIKTHLHNTHFLTIFNTKKGIMQTNIQLLVFLMTLSIQ